MKLGIVISLLIFFLLTAHLSKGFLSAGQKDDPCQETGIIVKNLTMLDIWYTRNEGACEFWHHEHVIEIKPEDRVSIFSDMFCKKKYCKDLTYKDYKSFDKNRDCRVRILPGCRLSDM